MKGTIRLGRMTPSNKIRIECEDEISGTRFLEISLTLEQLGDLVSAHGSVECEFELTARNVGKLRETKEEKIGVPNKIYNLTPQIKRDILEPFETSGWKAHDNDLGNHHNRAGQSEQKHYYNVAFTRFVDPPKEKDEKSTTV